MSELRKNPISGDWVIIAPARAARPAFLDKKKSPRKPGPRSSCPFEHPEKAGNWPPYSAYPSLKNWKIIVIPNKYPALAHENACSVPFRRGMYEGASGIGWHDLAITRDHDKNFSALDPNMAKALFGVFQERCRAAADDECLIYVAPFCNWGPGAGSSVWHPHYQILSLPVIPGHSEKSLQGELAYFKKNGRCVRCDMIKEEKKYKLRIVAENKNAIAFTPYASKLPFEVRILPKKHTPYFYKAAKAAAGDVAVLLQAVMRQLKSRVNDPDLNFYIHEAPVDGKDHGYHHWHVEVLPRVSSPAGFEFSTGIFIDTVDPDNAAAILRGELNARSNYH